MHCIYSYFVFMTEHFNNSQLAYHQCLVPQSEIEMDRVKNMKERQDREYKTNNKQVGRYKVLLYLLNS